MGILETAINLVVWFLCMLFSIICVIYSGEFKGPNRVILFGIAIILVYLMTLRKPGG